VAYTPNANRAVRGGKAVVSAKELADFKAQYGAEKDLTDLLNMDKGLQRKIPSATAKEVREKIDTEQRSAPTTRSAAPATRTVSGPDEPDMSEYKPRRTPKPLTEVKKPGTEVNYESKETSDMSFKRGGMTASRRADGIAQRGRTRGKMY
jgi:hypothetical protein